MRLRSSSVLVHCQSLRAGLEGEWARRLRDGRGRRRARLEEQGTPPSPLHLDGSSRSDRRWRWGWGGGENGKVWGGDRAYCVSAWGRDKAENNTVGSGKFPFAARTLSPARAKIFVPARVWHQKLPSPQLYFDFFFNFFRNLTNVTKNK